MITKEELYNLYIKQKLSCIKISKIKNIGRTTILKYLHKYNIQVRPSGAHVKYQANHDFFSKWSEDMAYCLGFIAADGHVWKERPFLTLAIHRKDIEILSFIKNCISPNTVIRKGSGNNIQICVHSKRIHKDLVSFGVDYNKTFNLKLPKMPKKYVRHFIRGYFDGDGSIWRTGRSKKGHYLASIISASKDILSDIQSFLNIGRLRKIQNKYYVLDFCQTDCLKLYKIMYENCNFKLQRKYDKFLLIDDSYQLWTKQEDEIVLKFIDRRSKKELIPLLPKRTPEAIQARKNLLRRIYEGSQNSKC